MYFHFEPICIATCNSLFNNFVHVLILRSPLGGFEATNYFATIHLRQNWLRFIDKHYENYIISDLT